MKTPSDVVQTARAAFNSGRTLQLDFRELQLKNLLTLLDENENEILEALRADLNKSELEGLLTEVVMCRNEIRSLLTSFRKWSKPEYVKTGYVNTLDEAVIYKDPYGVVLVISPWSYPVLLSIQPLLGAIAAGNVVVLKPSEVASATSELLARKIPYYLDNDCYQVFCGGVDETKLLLEERFDYIFFTGSPQVGQTITEAASKHLTPVTLELGGKNPLYLDNDVDMDVASRRILWGKCINAGQTCLAPDYILCTEAVMQKFVEKSKAVLNEWYGENPQNSSDYARIVNDRHMKRVYKLIDREKVAHGGTVDENNRYIEPTILINVTAADPIMKEEIFGPILPIINVANVKEAVDFINEGEKPLVLYIFSNKKDAVNTLIANTSSGGVCVNDTVMHVTVPNLPFGGVGNSGMGAYHGKLTFDTFVHKKSVLKRSLGTFGEKLQGFRYPPYTAEKVELLRTVLKPSAIEATSTVFPWYLIPFLLRTTSSYVFGLAFSYFT